TRELAMAVEQTRKKDKEAQEYTGAMKVPGSEKLAGRDLLQSDLGMAKSIIAQIKRVMDQKQNPAREADFNRSAYLWKTPSLSWRPAKAAGQRSLVYMGYREFLPK